ncbi:MAG: tetratricopeptide repeat protein [Gemmataceae bacterium]
MSENTSEWVIEVNEDTFEKEVLDRSEEKPVVVDFWAPGCQPCVILAPMLEKVVNERNGEVILAKINAMESQRISMALGVNAFPTVIAFVNRQPKPGGYFRGVMPEEGLREFIDYVMPSGADNLADQAKEIESTDAPQAETLYRQALEQDEKHEISKFGLVRVLVAQRKDEEASKLLKELTFSGPEIDTLEATLNLRALVNTIGDEDTIRQKGESETENAQAQYELGCLLASNEDYENALETLMKAGQLDPELGTSKVREAMVQIFHILGAGSDLATKFRKKLTFLS